MGKYVEIDSTLRTFGIKFLLKTHSLAICEDLASLLVAKTLRLLNSELRGLPLGNLC